MDAIQLALKVIDALEVSQLDQSTAPPYPWVIVGHEVFSGWDIANMTNEQLRRPEWDTNRTDSIFDLLWSMRAYAHYALRGEVLFVTPKFGADDYQPAVIVFWPPRKVGYPAECVAAYGTDENLLDTLQWLQANPLPVYMGARRPMYVLGDWQGKHKSQPIDPIPMWDTDTDQL